jgi:hypothetical protein
MNLREGDLGNQSFGFQMLFCAENKRKGDRVGTLVQVPNEDLGLGNDHELVIQEEQVDDLVPQTQVEKLTNGFRVRFLFTLDEVQVDVAYL